jgi:Tol biopolymer transport system component
MKPAALLPVVVGALLVAGCTSGGSGAATQSSTDKKTSPVAAEAAGPVGRIVFQRIDPGLGDTTIYTMSPDGSHEQQLFDRRSEFPHWSPDGSKVSIFCCDDGMAAHIVDPETAAFHELAPPNPDVEVHCGLWSPDAKRFACESYGVTDPTRNGIYSISTSDGGDLTRITTNPDGADTPGDYSPDGERMVFVRQDPTGRVGLFVTNLNGSGLREIPTPGLILGFEFFAGSWSPEGNEVVFAARKSGTDGKGLWVVGADDNGLHQLPIQPECGGAASDPTSTTCLNPAWSPDGTKIVFVRADEGATQGNIYTVGVDGSDLKQLTTTGTASLPDWGP